MSITGEKMPLFDIASEDDLLIDSQLDRASFDLRLSVGFNQSKTSMRSQDLDEQPQQLPNAAKRREEYKSRQSLAWDNEFFTSDGFLDLRELSLVNQGFKNAQHSTSVRAKRSSPSNLGCREAAKSPDSFLEFRVLDHRGKDYLKSSRHKTAHTTETSLASESRMKHGHVRSPMQRINQHGSRGLEMCPARRKECPPPPSLKPPKAQSRLGNTKPPSPRPASSARKTWLSKSVELGVGGSYSSPLHQKSGATADYNASPRQLVSIDCNSIQASNVKGQRAVNKIQTGSSLKQQNVSKAKRSLSPLPGDLLKSSKKPLRSSMLSERIAFFETVDQSATQKPKGVSVLHSISTQAGGSDRVKGLKKRERKTNSHCPTKKMHSQEGDEEKENSVYLENGSVYDGPVKEGYVEITNLFEGMTIESKRMKAERAYSSMFHAVGSLQPLRLKSKQAKIIPAAEEGRASQDWSHQYSLPNKPRLHNNTGRRASWDSRNSSLQNLYFHATRATQGMQFTSVASAFAHYT